MRKPAWVKRWERERQMYRHYPQRIVLGTTSATLAWSNHPGLPMAINPIPDTRSTP